MVHDMGGARRATAHLPRDRASTPAPTNRWRRELAPHFHVWGIDFRGHGDATPPENHRFDWGGFADDLLNVADAIGSGPITVFGHSLGGGVTLLAELRRPGTVRAAYLFEPIVIPAVEGTMPGGPSSMSDTARHRRASFPSRADALHRYASRPPLNQLRADSLFCYVEHGFRDMPDGTVSAEVHARLRGSVFRRCEANRRWSSRTT